MAGGRDYSQIGANRMHASRFGTNTTTGSISASYHRENFKSISIYDHVTLINKYREFFMSFHGP